VIDLITDLKERILFHYTDFIAFDGIFAGEGIRLCDIHTMNDKKEMIYFLEILEKEICKQLSVDGFEEEIPQAHKLFNQQEIDRKKCTAFATCFSMLEDDAAQWERYGMNGRGICIGFNSVILKEITQEIAALQPVFYRNSVSDHAHVQLVVEALENGGVSLREFDNMKGLFDNIYMCSMGFKHPAFKAEKEVRLTTITTGNGNIRGLGERNYIIMADKIKGYYNLNLRNLCRKKSIKLSDLIRKIIIGPKSDQSIEVFKSYLSRKGLTGMDDMVVKSDCPLR